VVRRPGCRCWQKDSSPKVRHDSYAIGYLHATNSRHAHLPGASRDTTVRSRSLCAGDVPERQYAYTAAVRTASARPRTLSPGSHHTDHFPLARASGCDVTRYHTDIPLLALWAVSSTAYVHARRTTSRPARQAASRRVAPRTRLPGGNLSHRRPLAGRRARTAVIREVLPFATSPHWEHGLFGRHLRRVTWRVLDNVKPPTSPKPASRADPATASTSRVPRAMIMARPTPSWRRRPRVYDHTGRCCALIGGGSSVPRPKAPEESTTGT